MYTLSDHIDEYFDITKDETSRNLKRGLRLINKYHDKICASDDYNWLEKQYTVTTVASTANYDYPKNCRKVKDLYLIANGIRYTPDEISSFTKWDRLQRYTPVISDLVTGYHIRDEEIYLYPTPSAGGNILYVNGLQKPTRRLKLLDYTVGSISVTNGSKTVTGTTTNWTSTSVLPGAYIEIDGIGYEIATLDSTTQVTLVDKYQGTTRSGISYRLGDVALIPEEHSSILATGAGIDYYRNSKETDMYKVLTSDYMEMMRELKKSTYAKVTIGIIPRRGVRMFNINDYPTIPTI